MNKSTKRNSVVKSSNHDKRGADRLAEAFPLLFGKTAEERSTIGKYTNKDKLKKRQSVVVGDENSAPSNVQVMSNDAAGKSSLSSTTPSKAIKKRSSFLSMSGLKRKPPQPKLSKTICITSPQPRGVELIEDKKKTFTAATAAPPLSNETPQQTDPSINFAHIYPEQADETMNLNDDVIQEDASQNVEYDMSNYEASIRRAEVVQMTADDSAVIAALRNFISTMESNDREQTKNDSNFQVIDEANMDIASTEEKPEVENKVINEYITLETEIKNAGDDKGMLLVPSIISDSRRSSASSYASLGVNSQRSSLCTEMIPVTDQYVSNTLGDKDVVPPRHSANGKIEKILINPRFMMMNEAMVSGLIIAEVVDRIQFENHTKFIMNVQVLPIPGISEPFNNIRMMVMKRLSEFKALRQNLMSVLKPNAEGIPPLPTRQVLSMGCDYSERDYLDSRQRYLRNWVNSIMVRQSVEGPEFRKILIEFLSN